MPNWTTNKLVITGDKEQLDELIAQVSAPYSDDREGEDQMIEGNFLLWNIIRPTNLDQYYQRGEYAEKPKEPQPDKSMESIIGDIQEGFATGMDWYNWNVRNWGTKWEIDVDQAWVSRMSDTEVRYELQTAWSPPVEALDNLAKQYPTLTFTLMAIDEGDLYAVELGWNDGKRAYEIDLPLTHEIHERLHGYCWACEDGLEEPDSEEFDEDRAEQQAEYKCRESQNLDLEVELGLE